MSKIEMILKHFMEKFSSVDVVNERYLDLYKEYPYYKQVFSYLHQEINNLFEFLNQKNESNKHYNANESRELLRILNNFDDLQEEIKILWEEIIVDEYYKTLFTQLRNFLSNSGWSTIPSDFMRIKIINYDPIFFLSNKKIFVKNKDYIADLINIGEWAFSLVSKYKDTTYNKFFAIKTLKKWSDNRELQRFKQEFEILKSFNFPYIVEVYSYDEKKNCYTMEYCDTTLKEYVRRNNNKLSFDTRKRICLQFLYAINYIHSKKTLHRDISYNNILLKKFDNAICVKLSDFWLIKVDESSFTKTDTEIKWTIIDPSLESFKDYDLQNEIYAIGFIVNFIFTGRQWFKPDKTQISHIVEKCIDTNKEKRFKWVENIIKEIELIRE